MSTKKCKRTDLENHCFSTTDEIIDSVRQGSSMNVEILEWSSLGKAYWGQNSHSHKTTPYRLWTQQGIFMMQ